MRHWEINSWYQRQNTQFDGLPPREFLRGRSWEDRYAVGLHAMTIFGVLE
jgi:hypothetical protein